MIIIHGENTFLSRKKLHELIDQAREKQIDLSRLEASKLSTAQLEQELGSDSLFGGNRLLVIEELHSLPTSNRKKELIDIVSQAKQDLILYEKRALTATMLKKFPGVQTFDFKITNELWELLDILGQRDKKKLLLKLAAAITQNDVFFVYTMIVRQTRLLIQIKAGGQVAGAPFMVAKLKKQADAFTLDQLLALHAQLFKLEVAQKTSTLSLDLASELDLLLFAL